MIQIDDITWKSNDGLITFKNMDCNEFMEGLKQNEFDLNLSDPPYGINAGKMTMGSGKHKFTKDKKWDEFIPSDECFNKIIETSLNQIIFGGNYFKLPLNNNWIIWDKLNPNLSFSEAELAWCSIARNIRIYKRYSAMEDNDGKKQHPTQKPIDLYRWILQNYTKPTDTILDCFGGSMSHAIAAHMERRRLTIIELDADYFKGALKRFDFYERQLTLFLITMKQYRYELRKGSKKDECPECNKKSFVPYIDKKDGKPAGERYGRCERINQCGYSNYPKADKNDNYEPQVKPYIPPLPVEYVPKELVEKTFHDFKSNVFFQYLVKTFGGEKAMELQSKYNIGTAKHGGTIFWQQDLLGRFRTGKVMYYSENGKRDKARHSWFAHSKIKPDFNFRQCFFGLHLVSKDYPVALCESEKTAVLMSVYMPEYTWIASGGSEMLNIQRLNELPRLDKVFADGGQFEKWEIKTRGFTSRQMDVSIEKAIKEGKLPEGSDILDLIQLT